MGKASRDKGRRGEQEVARIFREAGFDVDRVPNSGGLRVKGDITGLEGYHVEVKRQETLALPKWLKQAYEESDYNVPVVIFRRSNEDWHAVIPLGTLLDLLKRAAE